MEGIEAQLQTQADTEGMTEHLAQDATGQMPGIPGPDPLEVVALDQLGGDRLDAPATAGQDPAAHRVRIGLPPLEGGQELDARWRQLGGQLGVPVIAIAEDLPPGVVDQLGDQRQVVDVGRGQGEGGDDAGPASPQMGAKAIDGGFTAVVIAEARLPRKREQR